MLFSTTNLLQHTLAGDVYTVHFMAGTAPSAQADLYVNRESTFAKAVASCKTTLTMNNSDYTLTGASLVPSKVGAGQMLWLGDNSSQIVVPSTVTLPTQATGASLAASIQSHVDRYRLVAPVATLTGTDKNTLFGGAIPSGGSVVFGFRAPINLTKLQYFAGLPAATVTTSVDGVTYNAFGSIGGGTDTLTASASGINYVKLTFAAAVASLTGSFLFFGQEVSVQTAPTITHAVLVPYSGLSANQLAVIIGSYNELQTILGMQFSCGGPLTSGNELYSSVATVAAGQIVYPITFSLSGTVLASV
jgi:hypothetical protein